MRWMPIVLACTACSAEPTAAPKTIDVPLMPERTESAPPPSRDAPVEENQVEDQLAYFIGTWDGMVNGSFPTEMRVDTSSRFSIELKPNPKLKPCHLGGRFRPGDETVSFAVDESTCQAERPGAILSRSVVRKTDRELELSNEDGSLVIRYTRRQR